MGRAKTSPISLIRSRGRAERSVVLRARDAGVRAYSPRFLEYDVPRGPVEHPLFPGYVFVWISDESQWRTVRCLVGVIDFVRGDHGAPAILRPHVVQDIRDREGPTGYVRLGSKFDDGQAVRVRDGTSWGICRGTDARGRVRFLFSMLGGREHEIEMHERELVAA